MMKYSNGGGEQKEREKKEKFVRFVHGKVVTELSAVLPCNLFFLFIGSGKMVKR